MTIMRYLIMLYITPTAHKTAGAVCLQCGCRSVSKKQRTFAVFSHSQQLTDASRREQLTPP